MAVVGIDLGTTNTVVAAVRDGRATALKDSVGRTLLPSVVSFPASGEPLVGYEAKEQRSLEPDSTIFSIKRLIGRSWESDHVQKARPRFPFELKEGPGKATLVSARGADYTLPEISALVLERARAIAEERLGETVSDVVITVPANFNDLQRAATKVAARVAGLEVLRILNEPTAAALAYGFGKKGRERIAVYDFGGGTFDITLLDLSENVFEVLATSGDTFLGGDDVDVAIIDLMAEELKKKHGVDAQSNLRIREQFRSAAEKLKIDLSTRSMAKARVEDVGHGTLGKRIDFEYAMKRADFEKLAEPLVERTLAVCQEAMDIAGLGVKDLDQVLLVGGSTRIPLVRRRISSFFGKMPQSRVNPDEVVAIGAAIQATALESKGAGVSIPAPPDLSRRSQFPSSPGVQTGALGLELGQVPAAPLGSGTKTGLAGLKKTIPGTGGELGSSPPPARASVAPSSNKRTEHSILSALPKSPTARPPEATRPAQDTLTGIGEDDDNPRGPKTLMGVGEAEPPSDPGAKPPLGGMESSRPAALPLGTAQGIGPTPTRPLTGPSPSPALGGMNRTLVGVAAPANLPPAASPTTASPTTVSPAGSATAVSPAPGVPVNPRAPLTPGGPAVKPFKTLAGVGPSEPVGAIPPGASASSTAAGSTNPAPGTSGSNVPTAPMGATPMATAHPPKTEPMQTLSGVGASSFPPGVSDSKVTSGSTLSRLPSVSDSRTTTNSQLSKLGPSPTPADASVRTTFANLGKSEAVTPTAPEARSSSPDLRSDPRSSSPEFKSSPNLGSSPGFGSSPDASAGDLSFDDVTSVYPATRSLPPEAIPPKPATATSPAATAAEAARLAAQQSPTPALGQAAVLPPAAVPVPPAPAAAAPAPAASAASNFAKTMAFSSAGPLFPTDDPPAPAAADGSVAFDLSDLEASEGHDEDLPVPVRPDDAALPARIEPKPLEEITDLPTPSARSVPPPAAAAAKKKDDFLDLPSRAASPSRAGSSPSIDEADLPTIGGVDLPLVGGAQLPAVSASAHLPAALGGTMLGGSAQRGAHLPSVATQLPSARAQQPAQKSDDDLSISAIDLDELEAMEALDLSDSMPRSIGSDRGGALGRTQKVASSSSVTEDSISAFLEDDDAEDDDELDLAPPRPAPAFGATQLGVAPPAFSPQPAARPAAPQPAAPQRPAPLGGTQIGVAPQGLGGYSPPAAAGLGAAGFGATAPGRGSPAPSAATLPAQGLPTPGLPHGGPAISSPLGRTAMSSPLTSGLAATAVGSAAYDPSLDATAPGAAMYGGGGPLGETLPSGSAARTEHSVSTGLPRPPLLIDVTPLSLGVEVVGGYVDHLIERNSPIPCERTRTFATSRDDQSVVRVRVSQGEANRFDSNTLLGEVELSHLQPGARGSTRIDVTFSLDESGMLQVSARDQATGAQANATLRLIGIGAESRRH